jgi:CheY-like chemotaxis protein
MTESDSTLLVVDDDRDVRELLTQYLQACGFRVIEGADGLEALEQIERIRPSVVVIDLAMPRLGGLEAITRIHAFDPSVRIVVVTGEPRAAVRQEAVAQGARAVLRKPLDLEDLWKAVSGSTSRSPVAMAAVTGGPRKPAASEAGTGPQVLVVDAQPEMRALLESVLSEHGYRVQTVETPIHAASVIRRKRPDVVLLALEMPQRFPLQAVAAIQAIASDLPIILLSSSSDLAKRALGEGVYDYVTKPIDVPHLLSALKAVTTTKNRGRDRSG